MGIPRWLSGKDSIYLPMQEPRRFTLDPWVGKIPWRRERLPTPVFWPGEFHELYNPWGHKESDTTEQLSISINIYNLENGTDEPSSRVGIEIQT